MLRISTLAFTLLLLAGCGVGADANLGPDVMDDQQTIGSEVSSDQARRLSDKQLKKIAAGAAEEWCVSNWDFDRILGTRITKKTSKLATVYVKVLDGGYDEGAFDVVIDRVSGNVVSVTQVEYFTP
jgi:hypothetical protein